MARRWKAALAAVVAVGAVCTVGIPAAASPGASARGVTDLRGDTLTDPVGLGDATPSLSWTPSSATQAGYETRVASSAAALGAHVVTRR